MDYCNYVVVVGLYTANMTIHIKLTVHCPSSQGRPMMSLLEVTSSIYLNPSLGRPLGYSLLEMVDSFYFLSVRHPIDL